jgi:2-polyprenyl-3-methyl-5-hydroxy-6-metoxy-1,4-benzoquinol methylase
MNNPGTRPQRSRTGKKWNGPGIAQDRQAGPVERLGLDPLSPWWGEHRSRYRFASQFVAGRRTLDIACGTGYGSAILADAGAAMVVGIDASGEAVCAAQRQFSRPGLWWFQADGTRLPLADESFDVISTFETLEHIPANERFVAELARVTRPRGRLILSTPNLLVTRHYPRNPYHVREFEPDELVDLLRGYYRRVDLLGQHLILSYRVAPFLPGREHAQTWTDRAALVAWKVTYRLPCRLRDLLARSVTGRPFFPTEADYSFTDAVDKAHVLVALAEK